MSDPSYPLPQYVESTTLFDQAGAAHSARKLLIGEPMPMPNPNSGARGEFGDYLLDADDGSTTLIRSDELAGAGFSLTPPSPAP